MLQNINGFVVVEETCYTKCYNSFIGEFEVPVYVCGSIFIVKHLNGSPKFLKIYNIKVLMKSCLMFLSE